MSFLVHSPPDSSREPGDETITHGEVTSVAPRQRSSLISVKRRFRRYHPVGWPLFLARLMALLPPPPYAASLGRNPLPKLFKNPLVNVNPKPHMTKLMGGNYVVDKKLGSSPLTHKSSLHYEKLIDMYLSPKQSP